MCVYGMKEQRGCAKILFINLSFARPVFAGYFFTVFSYSIESKLCMVVRINFCSQNQGGIINHEVTRKIFVLVFCDDGVLCGVVRRVRRQQYRLNHRQ